MMIWKGFRFGLFLQIAVGPVCIFIFQTAATSGFFIAEIGVLGVAIVDVFYILAAIFGIGTLLNKYKKLKSIIHYFGAAVLITFGISNIIGFFYSSPIVSMDQSAGNTLWKALLLTLSNPLTILFWAGVFSTKIGEENIKQKDLYSFGFGAVLSAFIFLTIISMLGTYVTILLEPKMIMGLNLLVGIVLLLFGVKNLVKHRRNNVNPGQQV
ncbi:LysE family transporter [Bacillus sp. Cr_A10]|uniref:LysE family translocator n=1 Tax=Bacillus sp. Cr_A10 TaxID=3033993 RepID=UPI0023DC30F0|nr:LysE family transporter [Bacillus sp. Cr_A10]MDF2065507.1 LysE family transporter [Bacillus sp. Cr_A10]